MSTTPTQTPGPAGVLSSNPILDNLWQILDPREEIELVKVDGETVKLRTIISARRNITAIRALEAMLAKPEIAPIAAEVRGFLSKATAGKADGADIMRTLASMIEGVAAAAEIALNETDKILADAYGDKLPRPASEHFELGEVCKAMVPFFSRPLRAFLPGSKTAGDGASASLTTSGA